jgi:hypothetical protein
MQPVNVRIGGAIAGHIEAPRRVAARSGENWSESTKTRSMSPGKLQVSRAVFICSCNSSARSTSASKVLIRQPKVGERWA